MSAFNKSRSVFGLATAAAATLCLLMSAPAPGPDALINEPAAVGGHGTLDRSCGADRVASEAVCSQSCEEAPSASEESGPGARPPFRGYCQCSCGVGCTSSADCGGAPCRPFITCC